MKNFYPEQYQRTGQYPINHNYLAEQFADHEEIWLKVKTVVQQGDFTLGQAVDKFERAFAARNGGGRAIGVGSGTDALFLSLKALGIGAGDEVITTPFTFFATIGAIVTAGAKPVFVDVKEDFNINVAGIEQAITPQTKAIMPVHWSGNPCDMETMQSLAKDHGLKIVADACHAIEARYQGKGMSALADLSCFSMHPLKNLNVWGDGGVIVTHSDELADRLLKLRNHGLIDRDTCEQFAYNSRLDTIQAVVAQHLLDYRIEHITRQRIENAAYLDQHLRAIPQVSLPVRDDTKKQVFHLYMGLFERREQLIPYLQAKGIDAKVHYPVPMHLQPAAAEYGHQRGDFPMAEKIADNCMSLPVHEFISVDQLDHIIESVSAFYG